MLIDNELIRFCAEKTKEIETHYAESCVLPSESDEFPRSADDLDTIMQGVHGKPIYHRQLNIPVAAAKFRSFYVHHPDRYEIYYASGMEVDSLRYYKTKELLQIHLWQESLRTRDVVELVQNMILRASPASLDMNLGHSATSDTLGEIAAMQFHFPLDLRVKLLDGGSINGSTVEDLSTAHGIPGFVVQASLNMTESLKPFF